jgi:hypothetical protein
MGERFTEFDVNQVADALGAQPRSTRDVAHGDGQALDVGETTLEVYRDAGVARVTTRDARIELFRVPEYTVNGERVVFEQGTEDDRTRLQVRADGRVSFHPVLRAASEPQTSDRVPRGRSDSPAAHPPAEAAAGRSSATASEGREAPPEQQLVGRLGRDPFYLESGAEPSVAFFPLAIHDERGKTTWHRVRAVGEVADQVQEGFRVRQIKKGSLVQVTGQPVTVQEDNGKGGTRTNTVFHASSVVRMRTRTVPHPQGR